MRYLELMNGDGDGEEIDGIKRLQVNLLLAHYAHMNPERVDNWICISAARRVCLELGLGNGREMRKEGREGRRLWWVMYGMERSLCGILRLPLGFEEEGVGFGVSISFLFEDDIV